MACVFCHTELLNQKIIALFFFTLQSHENYNEILKEIRASAATQARPDEWRWVVTVKTDMGYNVSMTR